MANIETEGLVLRSYNLSDADKIVVFMTQNHGLIKGVAKGAKRLKSKFGSALEQFSIVNLSYFQKEDRELVNINQIELVRSYLKDASQIDFLSKFEYISELLIEFVPPNDPNKRLYNMSKICLETASQNPYELESIILYFEVWILKLCGFLPSWEKCNQCKLEFNDIESTNFKFDFQLICNNCQKHRTNIAISAIQRNFYNLAQRTSPIKFVEYTKNNKSELREVSQILRRIISQVLGKEFVGEKILTASIN